MFNANAFAKEIFEVLRSFDYTVKIWDAEGKDVLNPEEARRYFAQPKNMMVKILEDGENSMCEVTLSHSTLVPEVEGLLDRIRTLTTEFNVLFDVCKYDRDIELRDLSPHLDEGEHHMSKPLFEKEEMVHLTALGCDVHAAAWDNFVQNHKVELYRPVKHVSKAEARAGGVVGGYETNNLLALRMANIAPHVVDDTLANVFSTVAERLAAGQHDVVLRHVATVAIAATYLDAAYPSDLKEEEVEENCVPGPHDCADHKEVVKEENCTIKAFKAGNPIVTESIREFEAWFSSMSEEKLFETMELDENASERNRAAGGYTYEEWTVCDRCGGEGKDLDNGPSGSGPECAECGGEGGWPADDESLKEAADDVIAEGDLDEDLLVSKEDSEELEQEDVLLPKNGGNDLAREVTVADDEAQGEDAVQRLKTLAGVTGAQSQRPLNLR